MKKKQRKKDKDKETKRQKEKERAKRIKKGKVEKKQRMRKIKLEKGGKGLVRCHKLQHNDTQHNNIQNCQTQHNYKNVTLSIYRQYADSHIFVGTRFFKSFVEYRGHHSKGITV